MKQNKRTPRLTAFGAAAAVGILMMGAETGSSRQAEQVRPQQTQTAERAWQAAPALSPASPSDPLAERLKRLRLPHEAIPTAEALARQADLIVFGHLQSQVSAYPAGARIGAGELYHYVQTIVVRTVLRGGGASAPSAVKLVTDGIEPLPPASDPLNLTYTGPLAEGEYVFFLRRIPGTDLYALLNGWQALYPVLDGKLIALKQNGFAAYNDLTISGLQQKLRSSAAASPENP
ncbi:hypothetical protein SAMN02799630_00064 [Paenibacillus sp. UNCCL117]|uniref:hypothetical protein n=1 Tax=unclassified Paenibacillus TaxID=185978 RepID=UPI000886C365|nr:MULTISPECIES: hypothetical protein [unclassified Paenibacillus]SDC54000.1 hypothetical protein SAMN04488602_102468 [Paenibacillus sp. cl123]SFW11112.1 hypothetical protein SAMN02799630_00064 [Paenibacillus sp. UNCCL117]